MMKPVMGLIASVPVESARATPLPESSISLYCFRLPNHRGLRSGSGRNTPMNTWLSRTVRLVALIGRLADAKTELTDCISAKMLCRSV